MEIGVPSEAVYREFVRSPLLRLVLDNALGSQDGETLMAIYNEVVQKSVQPNIYLTLRGRIRQCQGNFLSRLLHHRRVLRNEDKILVDIVRRVMDPRRPRKGYVEVGTAGRLVRSIGSLVPLQGEVTMVHHRQDVRQSGFPRPYHHFVPLTTTYDRLDLAPESADLVSCFSGLHHCPEQNLEPFLESIHVTLSPGGVFLLREYDAANPKIARLATVVHSVFNAVWGVAPMDEAFEVRHFQSLTRWVQLVESKGFRLASPPLIHGKDPMVNTLLKFVKVGHDEGELDRVRECLISQQPRYTRPFEQNGLAVLQRFHAESTQNQGRYSRCWAYPYFRDVRELWRSYWQSGVQEIGGPRSAVQGAAVLAGLSTEYVAKGVFYAPVNAMASLGNCFPRDRTDSHWKGPVRHYQQWQLSHGRHLEDVPFHAQRYLPYIQEFWSRFANDWSQARERRSLWRLALDRQTVKNVVTGVAMTLDMSARAILATSLHFICGDSDQEDSRFVGLIAKGVSRIPKSATALNASEESYQALMTQGRRNLEGVVRHLVLQGAEVVEIAGQRKVRIEVVVEQEDEGERFSDKLYERAYLPDDRKKIMAFVLPLSELKADLFMNERVHRLVPG